VYREQRRDACRLLREHGKERGITTEYAIRKLSLVGHYSEEFLLANFTILIQVKFVNHSFPIVDG
jgi:hypothetical protein